jgi:ribosomal protein S18 acetylase RimI-like enzyme
MPTLRPYAPKDYPHFLALDLETAVDALGESTDRERALLRERWPAILAHSHAFTQEHFGAKDAVLWVLEGEGGRYLGHLWLTEKRNPVHGGRLLEVTTMGVVREARGEGLGRLLMQKAEAEARESGIQDIELSVSGNNRRARDLYRDLGYETVRRTMRKRLRSE